MPQENRELTKKEREEDSEIVRIRLNLEGERAKEFAALKEQRGLHYNTELVRVLIKEAIDEGKTSKYEEELIDVEVSPETAELIRENNIPLEKAITAYLGHLEKPSQPAQ